MRKIGTVMAMLLVMVVTVRAQVLYEISGNGLKKKSYLLGTYHLLPADDLANVKSVFKCFAKSEVVVGEIIMNEQEAAQKMAAAMMAEEPFTKYLTEEEQHTVDSVLKADVGAGLEAMAKIKPDYVLLVWEQLVMMQGNARDKDFMDSFFQTAAFMSGKPVKGFETIEQQLEIIAGDDEKGAKELAEHMKKGKKAIIEETQRLQEAYIAQDLERLGEMAIAEMTEEQLETIVYKRNRNWVEQMPEMMKANSCLVVVGAMHLVGEQGVVSLLKKKGYKVKAVK